VRLILFLTCGVKDLISVFFYNSLIAEKKSLL